MSQFRTGDWPDPAWNLADPTWSNSSKVGHYKNHTQTVLTAVFQVNLGYPVASLILAVQLS